MAQASPKTRYWQRRLQSAYKREWQRLNYGRMYYCM